MLEILQFNSVHDLVFRTRKNREAKNFEKRDDSENGSQLCISGLDTNKSQREIYNSTDYLDEDSFSIEVKI